MSLEVSKSHDVGEQSPLHIEEPKKRPVRSVVLVLCVLAVGLGGNTLLRVLSPKPQKEEPAAAAAIVRTAPVEVKSGAIGLEGSGFVRPRAEIVLAAQISGNVIYTNPNLVAGGRVNEGEELVRVDDRPYRAALLQAQANLKSAEANLAFLGKQIERSKSLSAKGFSAAEQLDQRENEYAQTAANIERLKASVIEAEINLERTVLTAPFDGQVRSETIDLGSVVRPGVEVARLFASDYFEVVVPFETAEALLIPDLWEDDLSAVPPTAIITAQYGDNVFHWGGYVDRSEAGIDQQTRTVDVVVRVPEPTEGGQTKDKTFAGAPPPLLEGTFVEVLIEGREIDRQVIVPRVAFRNEGAIWVATAENTLKVYPATVLLERKEQTILDAPEVPDNADVITSEIEVVVDGMAVTRLAAEGDES